MPRATQTSPMKTNCVCVCHVLLYNNCICHELSIWNHNIIGVSTESGIITYCLLITLIITHAIVSQMRIYTVPSITEINLCGAPPSSKVKIHLYLCVDMIRWERRRDPQGRIYYVDHNTRTTTWQKPTTENVRNFQQWQQQEATNLEQRSQQHQQRCLVGGAAQPKDPGDDGLGALPDGWGQLI